MRVARPPELPSYAIQMSPPTCCSRTKTCPCRAATIPGAGDVRGKRSQLAARFNPGTMRPNTRMDAAQPQKECGQPDGRPPTTWPGASAVAIRTTAGLIASRCMGNRNAVMPVRMFEPVKSHGMMTLHSRGAAGWDRTGRASATPEEIAKINATANATWRRIAGLQVHEARPAAETEQSWAKIRRWSRIRRNRSPLVSSTNLCYARPSRRVSGVQAARAACRCVFRFSVHLRCRFFATETGPEAAIH